MGFKMLKGKKMLLDWDNQWQQEKGDEHFLKTDEKEKNEHVQHLEGNNRLYHLVFKQM